MSSYNLRSNRRRNEILPASESSHGEEPSERAPLERTPALRPLPLGQQMTMITPLSQRHQVPVLDFAENDDDVIETSSRDFAEAVANARRTRRRIERASNIENQTRPTYFMHDRDNSDHTFQPIDTIFIDLEGGSTSEVIENVPLELENERPEPPKEATLKCPICMNPTVEEMTTRCGHIFCKNCITSALTARRECPKCGKKASKRGLVRVFLPPSRIID